MAYTNEWDTTSPPGGELAKKIDDHIRRLRLDLHERFNTLLKDDGMNEDPIVLKDELIGKVATKKLLIPPWSFQNTVGGQKYFDNRVQPSAVDAPLYASVVLPSGVTITRVDIVFDLNATASLTWSLQRVSYDFSAPGAAEILLAVNENQQGRRAGVADNLNIAVTDEYVYAVVVDSNNTSQDLRIYGMRVWYSCPDSRFTL